MKDYGGRSAGAWTLLPVLLAGVISVMTGCSGDSGEDIDPIPNPIRAEDGGVRYDGPAPETEDVQSFKSALWDKLTLEDRCGACHIEGEQAPYFVRRDDINLAYAIANDLVVLEAPADSRLVEKVATGHNCWRTDPSVCADTITGLIAAWANQSGAEASTVVLKAPPPRDVGATRPFPSDPTNFQNHVHGVLVAHCAECHSDSSDTQQQPYFASDDIDVAYHAAKSKIRLDNPAQSRIVERVGSQFHNCWSVCENDGDTLTRAIQDFAATVPVTEIDENLVVSRALFLGDGTPASTGGRIDTHVIARYEFKSNTQGIAYDTSGAEPALDLLLTGEISLEGGAGLKITGASGKAQGDTRNSKKLTDLIRATGEYSLEAWVVPDNVTQDGPATIVTYSGNAEKRNFLLGQNLYNYNFLNRNEMSDQNGMPLLSTEDEDEILQATLQHVVASYHPLHGRKMYVNGERVMEDNAVLGHLNDWDNTFALAVGNEVDNQKPWLGTLRFLAIHNRALTQEHIENNYSVGVGEKFFLLFGVSDLVNISEAFIVFEVKQFDQYSYLFHQPFFISLDDTVVIRENISVKGMRIGLNGNEIAVGQAYSRLDLDINATQYSPETGMPLSDVGTVIAMENGPELDQFFLTFSQLGQHENVRVPQTPPQAVEADSEGGDTATVGIRMFAQINASLSHMTKVPSTNPSIASIYATVQQQMPVSNDMASFVAANQSGIMQLTVGYCTELMSNSALRQAVFPGFDFNAAPTAALDAPGQNALIHPLLEALLTQAFDTSGAETTIATHLDFDSAETELKSLVGRMQGATTETTAVAICVAAMSNAAMLLH